LDLAKVVFPSPPTPWTINIRTRQPGDKRDHALPETFNWIGSKPVRGTAQSAERKANETPFAAKAPESP
jgi:hypothetical protein